MRWPKFLTYGNWGGAGWSGGEYVDDPNLVKWDRKPVDAIDDAFYWHDYMYQHGTKLVIADIVLLVRLPISLLVSIWHVLYVAGAFACFSLKLIYDIGLYFIKGK